MNPQIPSSLDRVAFISTRIAGTDGVSLEIDKWARVLERMGAMCSYIAGECDRPANRTAVIEEAHFRHPEIQSITQQAFDHAVRSLELDEMLARLKDQLRCKVLHALDRFSADVLIVENALAIPMNLPLGLALVQIIEETHLPCIAHHHDFYWERERFLVNAVGDVLRAAFPPALSKIQHVVINSIAAEEFSRRIGLPCHIVPNVMDFEHPPGPPSSHARSFRETIGITDEDWLILQPTRIVARKAIEHSVEIVRRLSDKRAKLVISHEVGDEGQSYNQYVREFAEMLDVTLILASSLIGDGRGEAAKPFTIHDIYPLADLVTYPSTYEGFGNAFLEAVTTSVPSFAIATRFTVPTSNLVA